MKCFEYLIKVKNQYGKIVGWIPANDETEALEEVKSEYSNKVNIEKVEVKNSIWKTLGKDILDYCKHKIYIPTNRCLNLANAVSITLYDREIKKEK